MVFDNKRGQAMVIGIAVVVLAIGAAIIFSGPSGDDNHENQAPEDQAGQEGDSETGSGNEGSMNSGGGETHTVEMTANGFTPQELTIDQGDTVVFENTGEVEIWPAVDIHPTHQQYDGTSLSEHCGNGENDVFDSCGNVQPGETYNFTFDKTGEWAYHDHTHNPSNKGAIIVE